MKNLKWFLGLALTLTFFASQAPKVLAVNSYNQDSNFGYYVPAWARGQVLGDTITNCPSFNPQYCQSPGVVGKDANGCDACIVNQPNQNQQPPQQQNNFSPCPSGQVYLCSGNTNPMAGANGLTCANGGTPTCGVLANNQQPQQNQQNQGGYMPFADMCKDNTALACVDGSGKFVTSPKVGSDGQPVCPTGATAKCGNYQTNNQQYQGRQPQQGPMMGPNQGQGDQNWEEQQAKMDAQRLKDMKRNANNMTGEAKRINAEITRLIKKGVVIPTDVKVAQQVITGFVAEVKAATDSNALYDSFINFQDAMRTIQDAMPTLYQLANWTQMKKEANKRLAELNKMYTKYSRLKSNIDLSSSLSDIRTSIDAKQTLFTQTDNEVKSGNADSLENFPDDFFGDLQDLYGQFQALDMASNISKNIKTFEKGIKSNEKAVTVYAKKKGVDASNVQELNDLLALVKGKLAEVKQMVATKFDPDELMSNMEDLMTAKVDLGDKLQELTGKGGTQFMPNIPQQNMNFQFNIPQAFGNQPQQDSGNQGGSNQQGSQQFQQPQGQQMAPGTF